MRIVAVGECTQDVHVDRGVTTVGGISLNFAVQARRSLGAAGQVSLVSAVGSDAAGTAVRAALARAGVEHGRVRVLPGATATQRIESRAGGERHFPPGGYDAGVLATLQLDADDLALIGGADVVVAAYFRQIAHLFEAAMGAARPGSRRVADLLDGDDLGASLELAPAVLAPLDLAFVSGDASLVTRMESLTKDGPVIVVTHGARGSTALTGHRRLSAPAVSVPETERVDTTGCGDAFQAAFTVAWCQGADLAAALAAGSQAAAAVIRHVGAIAPELST
jgi:fructoselysine 6-kinase